ncbi:hypothetical protein SYNTR_1805 [Candidatus Syntrophocurvum alkaliphilum]|uniref:Uncharacterized protein n=1 Tax=Candidatus Syntrophocurvum alkaliphilum TaxID=2293317 RepID=A0A6I6DI09_9FIRM|nr:hypothetical protein [Candidatus Syntrophocurvum alkaliphilum]QGU00399.1 hypothetical protein SYNTR_1805 [Candidatus Syntrophocurvum alkaliphilum]
MIFFDVISHGLWGGALFGWRKNYWWAFGFGVMPDILTFGPYAIYRLLSGDLAYGRPAIGDYPPWLFTMYDITHSLIIAGIIVFILFKLVPPIGYASLAWILHILMDIPSHSHDYFPTPFLYPISDFTVDGFYSIYMWGVNWFLLIIVYTFFFLQKRSQKSKAK